MRVASMKKAFLYGTVSVILLALASLSFTEKHYPDINNDKKNVLREVLFQNLRSFHYNQLPLNDDFSAKAYKQYIKRLDASKRFLTKQDIDILNQYQYLIDDEITKGVSNPLFDSAYSIINRRIAQAKIYYQEILAEPFDFSKEEYFEGDAEKRNFPENPEGVKEEWRKNLKYQALVRYSNKIEDLEKQRKNLTGKPDSLALLETEGQIEEKIRKEILKSHNSFFDRLAKIDEDDRLAEYYNALISVYCPHTEYFPPQEKENFDIDMSGKLEGIGAQLRQVDGEIIVDRIVPGSASWKQQELKAGDMILKVGQADAEPVTVTDMPLKDAVSLIRGKRGTEVRLTVKKPDGIIKVIPIIRDVVILEESFAKSAIIQHSTLKKKIGYIYLPSFYADFSRSGGRNSGDDIRIELEKLKKEKVDGIVLDLRNNGGGSLQDAITMTGHFIRKGPVVQVKENNKPAMIYEDMNTQVIYEGPLVVMINRFSASASEILAGALQDYGRAVIVGSKSSFGKGTVQRFVELDYYVPAQYQHVKPLGALKLTIQKFYRITGKSTQEKGVISDIILPDSYDGLDVGEKDLDYALPYEEINATTFVKVAEKSLNLDALQKKSQKRIKKDEIFPLIEENAERLRKQKQNTVQPLFLTKYQEQQKKLKAESEKYNNLKKNHPDLDVLPVASVVENAVMDSTRLAMQKEWHKSIKEDVSIYEALNVLGDWISKK